MKAAEIIPHGSPVAMRGCDELCEAPCDEGHAIVARNQDDMRGVARRPRGAGDARAYQIGEEVEIQRDGGILTVWPFPIERMCYGALSRIPAGTSDYVYLRDGRVE